MRDVASLGNGGCAEDGSVCRGYNWVVRRLDPCATAACKPGAGASRLVGAIDALTKLFCPRSNLWRAVAFLEALFVRRTCFYIECFFNWSLIGVTYCYHYV